MDLNISVYDITGAYLYPNLDKEIYMEIPLGYIDKYKAGDVLQ